jgi:hypothetical protein
MRVRLGDVIGVRSEEDPEFHDGSFDARFAHCTTRLDRRRWARHVWSPIVAPQGQPRC